MRVRQRSKNVNRGFWDCLSLQHCETHTFFSLLHMEPQTNLSLSSHWKVMVTGPRLHLSAREGQKTKATIKKKSYSFSLHIFSLVSFDYAPHNGGSCGKKAFKSFYPCLLKVVEAWMFTLTEDTLALQVALMQFLEVMSVLPQYC